MDVVITILSLLASVLLIIVVLVQNPKGGGLSATFGGGGNQFGGVRKTTDFLEKATWTLAIAILVLSLASAPFSTTEVVETESKTEIYKDVGTGGLQNSQPAPGQSPAPAQ